MRISLRRAIKNPLRENKIENPTFVFPKPKSNVLSRTSPLQKDIIKDTRTVTIIRKASNPEVKQKQSTLREQRDSF